MARAPHSRSHLPPRLVRALAGAAAVVALWAVYRRTASWIFSYDSLSTALSIEFGTLAGAIHPNHLLHGAAGWAAFQIQRLFGEPLRAVFVLQRLNAIFGAAAVWLLYDTARLRHDRAKSVLAAAFFAVSLGFWTEVTDAGSYAIAALAAVALVRVYQEEDRRPAWVTGAAHGVAVLVHQMLVLVTPAFLVALVSRARERPARVVFLYALGGTLAAMAPYALVALAVENWSPGAALFWLAAPAGPRPSGGIFTDSYWSLQIGDNLKAARNGLVGAVAAVPPTAGWAVHLVVALALGLIVALSIRAMRNPERRHTISFFWIWILSMTIFQFFWLAGAVRFRVLMVPAFIGLALELGPPLRRRASLAAGLAAIAGLAWLNFSFAISRGMNPRNSDSLERSVWVGRQLTPSDFFLFAGEGDRSIVNVYAAYFAPHIPARSVRGYFFGNRGGYMTGLDAAVNRAFASGGAFYVEQAVYDEEFQRAMETYGEVAPGSIGAWLNRFEPAGEISLGDYRVIRVRRK